MENIEPHILKNVEEFQARKAAREEKGSVVYILPNGATTKIEVYWKLEILKRDGFVCLNCGSKELLTIDHIVPLSKGGSKKSKSNLQTLCEKCNGLKADNLPVDGWEGVGLSKGQQFTIIYSALLHKEGCFITSTKSNKVYFRQQFSDKEYSIIDSLPLKEFWRKVINGSIKFTGTVQIDKVHAKKAHRTMVAAQKEAQKEKIFSGTIPSYENNYGYTGDVINYRYTDISTAVRI